MLVTVDLVLEAAVVALVVVTTALGTCVALRGLPAEMPAELRRLARLSGIALGAGLGGVLAVAVVVQSAGLGARPTVALEVVLAATSAAMVAEHAAVSRWLRRRWLQTTGAAPLPAALPASPWLRRSPVLLAATAGVCAAVLLTAGVVDSSLPGWTVLFGLAAAGQVTGILVVMAPRYVASGVRRPAR